MADRTASSVPGLGLTMADGGEKIEPPKTEDSEQEITGVSYGVPISQRRSSALLPRCPGAQIDPGRARSDRTAAAVPHRAIPTCELVARRRREPGSLPAPRRNPRAVLRRVAGPEAGAVQRFATLELHEQQLPLLRFVPAAGATSHHHPSANLLYTPNHFWLDAEESGLCHIGIDGFLADVAGHVDGVTFVTARGTHCPALALTIHGVEWPMSFPNPLMIQKVNSRLRSDPARLTADPYGAGWLFEGWEVPGRTRAGLVLRPQAAAWQTEERERLTTKSTRRMLRAAMVDRPCAEWRSCLSRQDLVCLFQHFFSKSDWTAEK